MRCPTKEAATRRGQGGGGPVSWHRRLRREAKTGSRVQSAELAALAPSTSTLGTEESSQRDITGARGPATVPMMTLRTPPSIPQRPEVCNCTS
jgi:hypothetical protein